MSAGRYRVAIIIGAVVVAIAGAGAIYVATLPGPASRTYERALPPPSATAYRDGGVPLHDPAIDELLAGPVTELVVEAGRLRGGEPELDRLIAPLRAPAAITAHGEPLAAAWAAAIHAFADGVRAKHARAGGGDEAAHHDRLREAVRELSQRFGEAGLGYFLEGRLRAGRALIQSYRVAQVVLVATGGAPRRVLSVRQLDRLNTSYAAVGMHNADIGDPLVMLDQIDERVATHVLPVVAPGAPYPLGDKAWRATREGTALAAKVGEAVRRELAAALPGDEAAMVRIAALLVERAELVEEWRVALGRKEVVFARTDDLFLSPELLDNLEGRIAKTQLRRARAIDRELAELEAPRIHALVHDLFAASTRRHEAQHAFDYDRDTELRYPAPLQAMLGPVSTETGEAVGIVRAARTELAAYVSELANEPVTPHGSLWFVAHFVFNRGSAGTDACYAAIVILDGLARQLGIEAPGRTYDRERLAVIADRLAAQPPAAIRDAAAKLWVELYGEPLTTVVDLPPKTKT